MDVNKIPNVRTFRSMSEFVAYANRDTDYTGHRSSRTEDENFTHSRDYTDAMGKVFRWDEGAERVGTIRARIGSGVERLARERFRTAIPPGTALVNAIVTGHPRPMVGVRKAKSTAKGAGKVHRIVVNICASAAIKADILERRGGAVLALADAIERRGGKVELVVRCSMSNRIGYEVLVKPAAAKLNLHSVAFAVAHPSMLRRMVFSAMETEPAALRDRIGVGGGYGMPSDMTRESDTIYLPAMTYGDDRWNSEESATRWVMEYLTEQEFIK